MNPGNCSLELGPEIVLFPYIVPPVKVLQKTKPTLDEESHTRGAGYSCNRLRDI
jgi:hypothetical protein